MKVRLTFTEELLGTKAASAGIFTDYIASKHPSGTPQRDELDSVESREEAGSSVFSRLDDQPGIFDYQVKGFFKDACSALNRCDQDERDDISAVLGVPAGKVEKLSAFKTKIDGCIFVAPRFITFNLPEGGELGVCERSIRMDTAQGPRVALVRSESAPAGTTIELDIRILSSELKNHVLAWLAYGQLRGTGQWRNSGKGRFDTVIL
jgi:hypothetical protein